VSLEELSIDDWSSVFSTNLWGPIAATQAAVPYLKASRGSIVSVSSVNAVVAEPNLAPYGVSKAALASFTKFAAADLASYGIRVNCLAPDITRTPGMHGWMSGPVDEEELKRAQGIPATSIQSYVPLGREGDTKDLGNAAVFLCSNMASYITGAIIPVDGGTWASAGWTRTPDNSGWRLQS
jgi:NAD(P)-dependent dehydrogenase (short-subunit alcohol dehydrogenase family)